MSYNITGVIYKVNETETFKSKKEGGKDFQKRAFVLDVNDGEYPQKIQLEFILSRCEMLDNYKIGQEVEVEFKVTGREWDGGNKGYCYFNTLQAQMIKAVGAQPAPAPPVMGNNDDPENSVPF